MSRAPGSERPAERDELGRRPLPPGHECGRDDPAYPDLSSWWADHRGYVPIQMPHAIQRAMQARGLSFGEAYKLVRKKGVIVLVPRDGQD